MTWALSPVPAAWASSVEDERTRPPALREAGGKGPPVGWARAVGPPCLGQALWRKAVSQVPPLASSPAVHAGLSRPLPPAQPRAPAPGAPGFLPFGPIALPRVQPPAPGVLPKTRPAPRNRTDPSGSKPPVRLPFEVEVSHPARPRGRPDWAPTELRSVANHPASPGHRSRIAIPTTPRAFQLQCAVVRAPRALEERSPTGGPPMARTPGRSGDPPRPLHQEPEARGPPDWIAPPSPFQLWAGQMRQAGSAAGSRDQAAEA
ncbi:hypothetical protein Mrose_02025 [Calidithermus roseus]|uniref:Uncharacterized protein n=1 Tax=Calidithermus roseus TaxID=1644118 RepID=A0A399EMD9_9DEIN|nr:hypothetical protein Mrose_02025 [Calidithermus roseus]